MSGTGRETFSEVCNGLGHPPTGTGRVKEPSRRSGMGLATLSEVRDGSRNPS